MGVKDIRDVFTKQVVKHLRDNKNEINQELLDSLRLHSKEGKKIALEILDLPKDGDNYYLDAFDTRISFNGNRKLKRELTQLKLHDIHISEIKKCSKDINYFLENYVQIVTPKDGVSFPDVRQYQKDLIDVLVPPENDSIIVKLGRQAGKSITIAIYLSWCFIFEKDYSIGIAANKLAMAAEFVDKVKKILTNIPIWMMPGISIWNKQRIASENGVSIMADAATDGAFRGFTINTLIVDECAFVERWQAFEDSIFPSQAGLSKKKNVLISTPKGLNHFHDIWVRSGKTKEESQNGYINFECDWKEIPRFDSKGQRMTPEEFQDVEIRKRGLIYWRQNYECEFMGSSVTLLNIDTLTSYKKVDPIYVEHPGLNIYEQPQSSHKYILTVDGAKDGKDYFSVQIVDITGFKFRQVASACMYVDYLIMPEFIDEWGRRYNNAMIIIENNEGAGQSIADRLVNEFEYENMYYDKDINGKKKKYPGFRTTPKSRNQILSTMKMVADNGKLEVVDKVTIDQLFSFVLIKNKYQADHGRHDDAVMSLALIFAIFSDSKNFEEMRVVVDNIRSENSDINIEDYLIIGSFDDGLSNEHDPTNIYDTSDFDKSY